MELRLSARYSNIRRLERVVSGGTISPVNHGVLYLLGAAAWLGWICIERKGVRKFTNDQRCSVRLPQSL
jgi:hypothetical protein